LWPLFLLALETLVSSKTPPTFLWGYLRDIQPPWAIIALSGQSTASWSVPPRWLWVHTLLWYGAFGYLLVAVIGYELRYRGRDRML
jgi:hypothetical protein